MVSILDRLTCWSLIWRAERHIKQVLYGQDTTYFNLGLRLTNSGSGKLGTQKKKSALRAGHGYMKVIRAGQGHMKFMRVGQGHMNDRAIRPGT